MAVMVSCGMHQMAGLYVYVTVKLCNQGFREIPEYFRDFAKSLIWSVISRNP